MYRASDGTTVEVISITPGSTTDPADKGQWLVPKHPNGLIRCAADNPRGWVRTPQELEALGIDLASMVEICPRCRQTIKEEPK